jgi:hypothetical protein
LLASLGLVGMGLWQMADFCRPARVVVEPAICAATAGRWPLKPMPGGRPTRRGHEGLGEAARRAAGWAGGVTERQGTGCQGAPPKVAHVLAHPSRMGK